MMEVVPDKLVKLSPKDEVIFKENAMILTADLKCLDSWIRQ